jgi:peptidoglycan/LPS O-acetylase OafA/YrhL
MKKWGSIQALRGVAVLGVVAFHLMSIEKKYSGGDRILPDFLWLGQSGVDLFFVISGFVMVSVTKGHFARDKEVTRFLWGRLTRIYPTYWFYFFLTIIVFLLKPTWVNALYGHQAELITSFFLLPNQHPLVMVSWSLSHELWFYSVFAVLLKLKEKWLLPALLVWGGIIAIANAFVMIADLPPAARLVLHPYSLEFIIGALAAIFFSSRYSRGFSPATSFMAIIAAIAFIVGGFHFVYSPAGLMDASIMRVSIMGALYGFLVLFLAILERENKVCLPRAMRSIGDISYTIYLSHVLVLNAIGRIWVTANPLQGSLWDNILVCLIMTAAVVAYGWTGYLFVEQPLSRASHRLRSRWFARC